MLLPNFKDGGYAAFKIKLSRGSNRLLLGFSQFESLVNSEVCKTRESPHLLAILFESLVMKA